MTLSLRSFTRFLLRPLSLFVLLISLPLWPALAQTNGPACSTYSNKTTANGLGDNTVYGVYAVGSTVYAATSGGLSISLDGGSTFANKTTANGLGTDYVSGVYAVGSTVYAATRGGLSISTNGGSSFTNKTTANSGLGRNVMYGVYAVGSTVYAATFGGLSISLDGGSTFANKTTANGLGDNTVYGVYAVGSTVYAATFGGLSISLDGGSTFANKTTANGLGSNQVNDVYAVGSTVYAATQGGGLSISTNGGSSFTTKTTANGLGNNFVTGVYAVGSTVYAATQGGLSISLDGGSSFTNRTTANGLGDNFVEGVYAVGSTVYAATDGGLSFCQASNNAELSSLTPSAGSLSPAFASATTTYTVSVDNATTSLTLTPTLSDNTATVRVNGNPVSSGSASGPLALSVGENTIPVVVTAQDGTTRKTYSVSVTREAAVAPGPACSTYTTKTSANGLGANFVQGVYAVGSTVYAATQGGLSISTDGGNTFTNKTTANGLGNNFVEGVYAVGSMVYAATRGGLSISTDGGNTFINKTFANGLGSNDVFGVYAVGSTVYAATLGGLSISTDGGNTFTNRTTANGLGGNVVLGVYAEGSTVYAATAGGLSFCPPPVSPLTLALSASPDMILTTGTTTLSATVSGGTGPYSYAFSGPGMITQTATSNTASVSNLPAGVQTFTVTVSDATTPTSQTISATASVTVTPQVSITVIDASASEAGSDGATFRISIDQATSTPISVSYTLDGTASAADYTPTLTGSATIQTGNTYVDVVITPIDDASVEGSETISLQLVSITGDPLGNPSSATATITDNDVAYLTVDPQGATTSEGVGTYVSNVRLRLLTMPATGGSMAQSTTVTMGSTNLSTAPADFSLLTTTLVFPANAVDNATQSFSVAIVDDNLAEGSEFFDINILSAASSSGTPLIPNDTGYPFAGGPRRNRQTVQILDNDVPMLTVSGNGQTIVNGSTNPSVANNTDFGSVVISDTRIQSFVIASTGTASLTVTSLTLTGVADFNLENLPVLPLVLAVGNSQTISVGFTPTTTGLRSATLGINTKNTVNGNTESRYTAALQGTGAVCSLTASIGGTLTVCAGQATNLTASGGTDYIWNTGATTATISATAGTYSVTVLSGICSATTAVTVISIANPIIAISGNLTICAGQSTTLTATAGASYVWSNTQTSQSISVSAAGPYSVTVTAASGCSNTGTASVTVNALPVPTLISSGTVTCANPTVTLTAGGGTSYTFSTGASQIGGSTGNTATVTAGGTYTVTVANANGCTSTTTTTVLSNTVAPSATITASSLSFCTGTSATLTAGGGTSYTFSAGASQIGGSTGNTATVTAGGTYTVTVASANGCTSTTTITVTRLPLPDAPTLTATSRTVFSSSTPLSLTPFINLTGNPIRFFAAGGAELNPPNVDISTAGVQSFSATQTNASLCQSLPTPFSLTVQLSTTESQTNCRSSSIVLTANALGTRYEWYKNGQSAPFKLTEIASIQKGTATASLTLVSIQTTAKYYCKVFDATGSFQWSGPFTVTVNYGCVAPGARLSAHAEAAASVGTGEPDTGLRVVLAPNPVEGGLLRAVVTGAEGQPLRVSLTDLKGQVLRQQNWLSAEAAQAVSWDISQHPAGLYLLRASTGQQGLVVKVIHP